MTKYIINTRIKSTSATSGWRPWRSDEGTSRVGPSTHHTSGGGRLTRAGHLPLREGDQPAALSATVDGERSFGKVDSLLRTWNTT